MDPGGTTATGQPLPTQSSLRSTAGIYQDGGLTSTDSVLTKSAHAYADFIEAGMLATHSASNHSTYNRRNQLPESTCKVLEQLHITQSTRPVTVPPQSVISWSQVSQLHIVT